MSFDSQRRQATLSWLFVGVLFVLCGVLGVLQYRWIGEVSVAARERLRASMLASLERVSRDFQIELNTAFRALVPESAGTDPASLVRDASERYATWKASDHQGQLFRSVALAVREGDTLVLRTPDSEGRWQPSPWPPDWSVLHDFMQAMVTREGPGFRGGGPTG